MKTFSVTPLSRAYLANNGFATVGQGLCDAFLQSKGDIQVGKLVK